MSNELVPYSDLEKMATQVVRSRMFPGITTPEAAMTLFLLCQSEGLHPMQATMRYHVIQGRPAMKADAMLAEFMRRGGTVKWKEWTNEACEAEFKSQGCPEGVTVRWTMEDAKRAGVTGNPTWTKYPRQMLKARVASDGVRMADPAVNQGRYTPEETQDFEPEKPSVVQADAEVVDSPAVAEAKAEAAERSRRGAAMVAEFAPDRFDEKNAAALMNAGAVAPPVCTLKGCDSPISEFESTSKQFMGRRYFQCAKAYAEKKRAIKNGSTNAKANASVAAHYRAWAEPWPRKEESAGKDDVAPMADNPPEAPPSTTAPAPSDVLDKINAIGERMAAEAKGGDVIPF